MNLDHATTFLTLFQNHTSQPRPVLSGVPQGSVLGPLLFLVYVNSIASELSCSHKIFADDLKIYACVEYPNSPEHAPSSSTTIQRDIDILSSTAASWGLHMNVKKCAVLRFSRFSSLLGPPLYTLYGQPIPCLSSSTDLGVLVDTDLKFHGHVQKIAHKAGGLAHSFLRSTVCRSQQFMLFLLTTHIRPLVEYCSCVWRTGFVQDSRLLERIQRHWTKQTDGMALLPYGERLKLLNLYSIQGRLLRADLIQCWKIFHGPRASCLLIYSASLPKLEPVVTGTKHFSLPSIPICARGHSQSGAYIFGTLCLAPPYVPLLSRPSSRV